MLLRDRLYFLSGPTKGRATYTDITGRAPEEGAFLARWNAVTQSYQTHLFTNGVWQPVEPRAETGEGVAVRLPPGPPDITMQPQSLAVAQAHGRFRWRRWADRSHRWLLNAAIAAATNATLTTNAFARYYDVGGAPRHVEQHCRITISFPPSMQVSPDGVLHAIGTDGSERIYVYLESGQQRKSSWCVDGSGNPSGSQVFPSAALRLT